MPTTSHIERHFVACDTVRDVVIGMADGLTVPFARAARLSGAVASTDIVVVAGLAKIAAGGIAMGLGGYLKLHSSRGKDLLTPAQPQPKAAGLVDVCDGASSQPAECFIKTKGGSQQRPDDDRCRSE